MVTLQTIGLIVVIISFNRNLWYKQKGFLVVPPSQTMNSSYHFGYQPMQNILSFKISSTFFNHPLYTSSQKIQIKFFFVFNYFMEFLITRDWCTEHFLNWNLMLFLWHFQSDKIYSKCIQYSFILNISIYFDMPLLWGESNNFSTKNPSYIVQARQ